MHDLYDKMTAALQKYDLLQARKQAEVEELLSAESAVKATMIARTTAQKLAVEVQTQAHATISFIVNKCLAAVFDDPYEFRITFTEMRGKTEARIEFIRDGLILDNPIRSVGGGVIDVATFGLRVAAICLRRPAVRRLLILDEPFRFVSADKHPRVVALLEMLSKETEMQIIQVTHIDALKLGTIIHFGDE